jgi:hypothetical protein
MGFISIAAVASPSVAMLPAIIAAVRIIIAVIR